MKEFKVIFKIKNGHTYETNWLDADKITIEELNAYLINVEEYIDDYTIEFR